MPENHCVNHFDRTAVGFCSRCNNPVCLDCLDLELGQPLCINCKGKKSSGMILNPKAPPPLINPTTPLNPKLAPPAIKPTMAGPFPKSAPPMPSRSAPPIKPDVKSEPLKITQTTLTHTSPFDFKGKAFGDDPLGIFGGPSAPPKPAPGPEVNPAAEPPKATPSPSMKPVIEPPKLAPDFSMKPEFKLPPDMAKPVLNSKASLEIDLSDMGEMLKGLNLPKGTPSKTPGPSKAPPLPYDLETLIQEPKPLRPPFPEAHFSHEPGLSPLPFPSGPVPPIPVTGGNKKKKIFLLAKIWTRFLIRRAYEIFEPTAKKLKIPTYVFLILLAAAITGLLAGIITLIHRPSVALTDTIPPIHLVLVNSGQISEMDVTTYSDLQGQLQKMGFTSALQMTIPQLPSPNYFDVSLKEDVGTYAEILKTPGQITPHLSFVTVFTNGTWFSTNACQGTDQDVEYHVSEFYPKDSPDQLYIKHVQNVEKFKQDRDWQVQLMSENRFIAALSDHLRWFLVKKDIPAYKADFALWQ